MQVAFYIMMAVAFAASVVTVFTIHHIDFSGE